MVLHSVCTWKQEGAVVVQRGSVISGLLAFSSVVGSSDRTGTQRYPDE